MAPPKKRKKTQPANDLPCTSMPLDTVVIDNAELARERAEQHRIITARMPIHGLKTEWTIGKNRKVDWKRVQMLCAMFKTGGVKRTAKENRLFVLCDREDVIKMQRHMGLDEHAQTSPDGEALFFEDWCSAHGDDKVEVMAGQHRIKALEMYVLQMKMEKKELWWTCDFYDRGTLPDWLNLELRVNRKHPMMVDSHGQIWTQVVAASSINNKLLREKKKGILKGEIRESLYLSSDIDFPAPRLAGIWRNERWREMTSRWCETTVGRDTFNISTWYWMITCRIDDYWFSAFRSVMHTLSQLPGDAPRNITGADWKKLSNSLTAGRTEADIQQLFYEGQQISQGTASTTTRRRPGFLALLADDAYRDVCVYIKKTPQLRFADIHRLLNLTHRDGRILFRVMGHIVSWLNPTPTVITNHSDNKKPALRNDLVPMLQHCSDQFVRETEKRLDVFLRYGDGMTMMGTAMVDSPAEAASVLLQQEVMDFTRAHIKTFKAPAARAHLERHWSQVNDEDGSQYACRFADDGEWLGLLEIVCRYVGDGVRDQWTTSPPAHRTQELASIEPRQVALEHARDLFSFLKSVPALSRVATLDSAAFRNSVVNWFLQQEESSSSTSPPSPSSTRKKKSQKEKTPTPRAASESRPSVLTQMIICNSEEPLEFNSLSRPGAGRYSNEDAPMSLGNAHSNGGGGGGGGGDNNRVFVNMESEKRLRFEKSVERMRLPFISHLVFHKHVLLPDNYATLKDAPPSIEKPPKQLQHTGNSTGSLLLSSSQDDGLEWREGC
ncbi:hypothetical protein FALBO_131 [Fusarium albosuccineum]|uniref:Uncharacterized protein n=1 Tax=Fusarium albosuccineum TaxID=1237068 RepID=A0A8H4LQS2_9HYPO|nr:hypothetical protein FALBO_131 [Fusarium albosuccineum]